MKKQIFIFILFITVAYSSNAQEHKIYNKAYSAGKY